MQTTRESGKMPFKSAEPSSGNRRGRKPKPIPSNNRTEKTLAESRDRYGRQADYPVRTGKSGRIGSDRLGSGTVALLAALICGYGLLHLSPWAASWDEVDFILALDRFDLLNMQPHAPGYPFFILGGRLMEGLAGHSARALDLWNLLLTASSVWPISWIARRWIGGWQATLAAGVVLTLPMNAALATGPMSEGAALALLWWHLWTLLAAAERRTTMAWTAASLTFGLLMGTRLSYAPFGLGLLLVWLAECRRGEHRDATGRGIGGKRGRDPHGLRASLPRRTRSKGLKLLMWLSIAAVFQLLWILGLAVAEGGWSGTVSLAEAFAAGHFSQWGGGVAAAPMPFADRLLLFVGDNLLWTGGFARSVPLLALAAALLGAVVALGGAGQHALPPPPKAAARLRQWLAGRTPAALLALPTLAYAVWALLGQNIAKPRHAAPLAALLAFALAVLALRAAARRPRGAAKGVLLALTIALAAAQTLVAAKLVSLQASERPAVYQLADYLRTLREPAILYTWEEERVLNYLNVPVQTRPIFTYEFFRGEIAADRIQRVLLTGKVWAGFRSQAAIPDDQVKLVATFRSDSRLDPVYGTIELYEWVRPPAANDP